MKNGRTTEVNATAGASTRIVAQHVDVFDDAEIRAPLRVRADWHRSTSVAEGIERALSALFALDPSCDRETWVRIGMSAKSAGISYEDFDRWSSGAPNYGGERNPRAVWNSFKVSGGTTAATLFGYAIKAGWQDPARKHGQKSRDGSRGARDGARETRATYVDVRAVWRQSEPATAAHGYITRKLGLPDGLRVYRGLLKLAGQALDGALLVPAFDADGMLQSWQAIPAGEGKKLNAPGATMKGGRFLVGGQPRDGEPLYLCEGIGAAWSAHQATGKPAVVTFGAGNCADLAADLHKRHPAARIVIVADRGKEGDAERIARSVGGAWAGLPAEWPSNSDVNDLHKKDGLAAVTALLAKPQEPPRRFRLLTAEELAERPPVRWRVRGVLPAEGLAAVAGPPGCGKSFLLLDLLGAVAEGREWFARRVEPCAVTYCALEGEAGIAQRLQAYRARYGGAPACMRFMAQPFTLLESPDIAELAEAIRAAGGAGGIVAIDTLNRATVGADENDSRDMGRVIEGAKLLQAALGGLVLLVHHTGKDASRGLRGHSSLLAALDAVIEVSRDGDRREWRTTKAKDAGDGQAHAFRLEVVEVGTDEDNETVTSCVVEPTEAERKAAAPVGGHQKSAWDCIGELLRAAGDIRPDGAPSTLPPGRPAVPLEAAIEAVGPRLICEPKRRRERATEAIRGLCSRRLLHHVDGWLWCG